LCSRYPFFLPALDATQVRLVQDQQSHVAQKRLGNLDHLLVRPREIADRLARIEIEAELGK
jgi:hypothetical protein